MTPVKTKERRAALRRFLNNAWVELGVALLIIASAALLLLEVWEPHDPWWRVAGIVVSLLFAVELSLRFVVEQRKSRFFTNYFFDLLSLAPLLFPEYLWLRAFRLLRLFRLGALMSQSSRRLRAILRQTAGEQLTVLIIIAVVVVAVALVMTTIEPELRSIDDAFWWALLSLVAGEPIGVEPETTIGKLLTLLVMLGGLTVFALLTGTVSAVMADRLRMGWRTTRMEIDELEDHIIICGWNRSGPVLLREIMKTRRPLQPVVLVAEVRPADLPDGLEHDPDGYFYLGDYTRVEVLQKVGVARASRAILLADRSYPGRSDQDRDARTVLAALTIEKLYDDQVPAPAKSIFTCAELLSRDYERILKQAGVEEVVIGDEYSATILAASSRVEGVVDIANDIFSAEHGSQIFKQEVPTKWIGRKALELQYDLKVEHDCLLFAVETRVAEEPGGAAPQTKRHTITNPPAEYTMQPGDRMIVLAKEEPKW